MRLLLLLIILLLVMWVVYVFLYQWETVVSPEGDSDSREPDDPGDRNTGPGEALKHRLQVLLGMSLAAKKAGLDSDCLEPLRAVVYQLRRLLPELNRAYPAQEITSVMNRLVEVHLPKLIYPFVNLTPSQRSARQQQFIEILRDLESQIEEIQRLYESNNELAFDSKAAFLKKRYGDKFFLSISGQA